MNELVDAVNAKLVCITDVASDGTAHRLILFFSSTASSSRAGRRQREIYQL